MIILQYTQIINHSVIHLKRIYQFCLSEKERTWKYLKELAKSYDRVSKVRNISVSFMSWRRFAGLLQQLWSGYENYVWVNKCLNNLYIRSNCSNVKYKNSLSWQFLLFCWNSKDFYFNSLHVSRMIREYMMRQKRGTWWAEQRQRELYHSKISGNSLHDCIKI